MQYFGCPITYSPSESLVFSCILYVGISGSCLLLLSTAAERSGSGVPGQISPATCGDPRVCSGQQQDQALRWWLPWKHGVLLNFGEAQPQGVTVWGRHGGGLVGTSLRHTPLEALCFKLGHWLVDVAATTDLGWDCPPTLISVTNGKIRFESEPDLVSWSPLYIECSLVQRSVLNLV